MSARQTMGLLGAPSSLAAHWPGQEKAPHALRAAGLVGRLRDAGVDLIDHGDLPVRRFRPDRNRRDAQNVEAVAAYLRDVGDRVHAICAAGQAPLVIGGECTTTIGVVSGMLRRDPDLTLLYIDGGYDLHTPVTNPEGILDSMGVAHMLGEPRAERAIVEIGPRVSLLEPEAVLFFGQDQGHAGDPEQRVRDHLGMRHVPASAVRGQESIAAAKTLAHIEQRAGRFLIHFDVDVIDFVDCPIADVPQFNSGLTLESVCAALRLFVASPRFGGLVLTEFNPDHADPDGADTRRFLEAFTGAFAG